ncbi:MAG: hypothetical protein ACM3IJ_03260 [Candidatus Levyibacteriota bacterium]
MSLAQVTRETRIILKIAGAASVLAIIIFMFFKGGSMLMAILNPPKAPPPEQKFGALPPIDFPKSNEAVPEFTLNTVTGGYPGFGDRIKVYALKQNPVNITALNNAKNKAANAGYGNYLQSVTSTVHKWSKPGKNNILTYDIVSFNFSVESDFATNPTFSSTLYSGTDYLKPTTDLMDALSADRSDIDMKNVKTSYYTIVNTNLTPADQSSGQIIRLDFYQNQVDEKAIYYPTYNTSPLYLLVANPTTGPEVVSGQFHHFTPDLTTSSTYPLKRSEVAYEDLKNGKGFIASPAPGTSVEITSIDLGYYLGTDDNQQYLMPILVFTGKNNFLAYVDAIAR